MIDKTKEEFLKPFLHMGIVGISPWPSYDYIQGRPEEIAKAMQAYADQEKRKEATNFFVFCRRRTKELEGHPWECGRFDCLCSDQKYNLYLQFLQSNTQ